MPLSRLSFPQAVLFDWDNTLVDTTRGVFHIVNAVLTAFSQPAMSFEAFSQLPPAAIRTTFAQLLPDQHHDSAHRMYHEHALRLAITPFSHVYPLLRWLKTIGVPMAVVSNKDGDQLRREIAGLGWDHFFFTAVGTYDTAEEKPSPVPLLHALTLGQLTAGQHIWFLGDSMIDVHCGQNAGCRPISVGQHAHTHQHMNPKFLDLGDFLKALQDSYHLHARKALLGKSGKTLDQEPFDGSAARSFDNPFAG
jgi:phosphoglycolate phosphatase